MYGNAAVANSKNASIKGSNAANIPPKIFSNPINNGSSFLPAPSTFENAATNPPTAATIKPIPVAFNAVPNDTVATLALFKAPPMAPIGPPALSNVSIQSAEPFLAPLILSSKSSISLARRLKSSEPAAVTFNCFFNSFKSAIDWPTFELTSMSISTFSAIPFV